MEELLQHIQEVLGVPAFLVSQCTFLPEFVKEALISCINFIPWLYILYYVIERVERFLLKHINVFIKLVKKIGPVFGSVISVIPECGYQVIASTFYSRKMITRGTLLAFFISCSDDALPLLFMDLSKAFVIIPIIIIKVAVGIIIGYLVDVVYIMRGDRIEGINAINTDLYEPGCCHHRITTRENPPYWWMHPFTHTVNIFIFTFLSLLFIESASIGFGGSENLAEFMMISSPVSVIGAAVVGLIPNCVVSIFLAVAFVKGIISFPALLAGLVTTTGLGLATLTKRSRNNSDNNLISVILLIVGIVTGLLVYYNMQFFGAV